MIMTGTNVIGFVNKADLAEAAPSYHAHLEGLSHTA
jgi:hypothetical protein